MTYLIIKTINHKFFFFIFMQKVHKKLLVTNKCSFFLLSQFIHFGEISQLQ